MTCVITPTVLQNPAIKSRGGLKFVNSVVNQSLVEACKGHKGLLMTRALDGRIVVYTDTRENWQACMTADEALRFNGRIE
jgi:hypothetical protein